MKDRVLPHLHVQVRSNMLAYNIVILTAILFKVDLESAAFLDFHVEENLQKTILIYQQI